MLKAMKFVPTGYLALLIAWIAPAKGAAPFFDPAVPVHGTAVDAGAGGEVARGLLLRVGAEEWVVFDQDLLRPALWFRSTGGKAPVSPELMAQASWENPTQKAGVKLPAPAEKGMALTPPLPGVGEAMAAILKDPRPVFGTDPGRGGLEGTGRKFLGYHFAGSAGVLSYRCGESTVREWYEAGGGILQRHLEVGPGGELVFLIGAVEGGPPVKSNHPGLKLAIEQGLWIARLAASKQERRVSLIYGESRTSPTVRTAAPPATFPARWKRSVQTRITPAAKSGPGWTMDRIGLPEKNPWDRRVRPADLVFLSPEQAAVVTFEGDVWRLDLTAGGCRWTRIAAGLCEPMSIEQVEGVVQVFTRHGIVRLRDLNGDGETDFYENHSSLILQTASTRGYPLDMEVDEKGRTWCSIGGIATDQRSINNKAPANPHSGAILMISADGSAVEVVGRHAREPFFARDPRDGRIAMTDQQGNWVPSSGSFPVLPGSGFGYGGRDEGGVTPAAVWIPHDQDTSSASPLWLRGSAFKAWEGGLLNLSYGTGRLFLVRHGEGWPAKQGAVIPLEIETGLPVLHARVNPGDGSVWLAGFRIYDSRAPELEGLGRLRPTGDPLSAPVDARVVKEGVVLHFDQPLDPASVKPEAVQAKEWQYRRSGGYGSPRLKRDGSQGTDPVATGGTFLAKDGKSVFVHVPDLKATMQLEISHRFHGRGVVPEPRSVFFTVDQPPAADWPLLGFEPPQLDASLVAVQGALPAGAQPTAELGREVSLRYGCMACHSADGRQEGHSGPTWKGLHGSERRFIKGEPRVADDAYLIEAILEPDRSIVEGYTVGMASYAGVLSEVELESIVLYIRSLK
jgi:mono/diheme cytochrome c family protein